MSLRKATWAGLVVGLGAASCGRTGLGTKNAPNANPPPEPTAEPTPSAKPPEPKPEPEPVPEPECTSDECDDGLVCNGIEACDPKQGCVAGEPVVCDAPGASCDENTGRCVCEKPFLLPDCRVKGALFAPLGRVKDLVEEQSVLWVSTTTGLWALDFNGTPHDPSDDSWTHFDELIGASETGRLVIDEHRTKWVAGTHDPVVVRLDDGSSPPVKGDDTWTFYHHASATAPLAIGVDQGNVWLGGWGETRVFSDAATPDDRSDDLWRSVSELGAPERLIDAPSIEAISNEQPGVVWLGSSSGLLFAYDTGFGTFTEVSDVRWSRINDFAFEGNFLWVSYGSGGALEPMLAAVPALGSLPSISSSDIATFAAPHSIEAFDVDPGGQIWISDGQGSLSCRDASGAAWLPWSLDASVSAIRARSQNDLWLGAENVVHIEHGGSCEPQTDAGVELFPAQSLRSPARDVAIEGDGVWIATERGVDYLDTGGTPLERRDDRWAHFDTVASAGLEDLQGALVGADGTKYFWGQEAVFALDDSGSPFDEGDDRWVEHPTPRLWVSGVLDEDGRLLVVARSNDEPYGTVRLVVFDPAGTPGDGSDDTVVTIDSGIAGGGRNMTIDSHGELWVATETNYGGGNLYHWDRAGTPLDGSDDVWTPVRPEDGRVWKLEADPTGGIWGTLSSGVFQFYDGGTPTDLSDDYWHLYPELGSAMDIGPNGIGWFRMPGGAGILDPGGTPRDPSDDVATVLLSPDALRFQSNLWTNGVIDDQGRFWVVDEYLQIFELAGGS